MSNKKATHANVIEPPYFSNWADLFFPKVANRVLPLVAGIDWITPNIVTLFSFFLYVLGCLFIFIDVPNHLIYTAVLLPVAYIGDCLDGQLARTKKLSSEVGNYLDKVVDVLKIYIITLCLSIYTFEVTQNVLYIYLGFTACFFFNFRYYLKLETIFSQVNKDPEYLVKCSERRRELYRRKAAQYTELSLSISGKLKLFWLKHRSIFWVDEAEFVVFTSLGAVFDQMELVLWVLAISQFLIAMWRLYERGYQTHKAIEQLLDPMRK